MLATLSTPILGPLYAPHVAFSSLIALLWAYPRIEIRYSKFAARLSAVVLGCGGSVAIAAVPAHAQFLNGGREFFTASFEDSDELIDLLFNVLLAVYVLYIAVSAYKIFGAMRSDEGGEWMELAKTPLKIILAITIIDAMIALVVGGGAG